MQISNPRATFISFLKRVHWAELLLLMRRVDLPGVVNNFFVESFLIVGKRVFMLPLILHLKRTVCLFNQARHLLKVGRMCGGV